MIIAAADGYGIRPRLCVSQPLETVQTTETVRTVRPAPRADGHAAKS